MSRHRRSRSRLALVSAVVLVAVALLVWDRSRVERTLAELRADAGRDALILAELEDQRRIDCVLYTFRALQRELLTDTASERCLIVAAAAAVDIGGCRPAPVRPDLDTSPEALDACLALASAANPGPGG